MLVRKGASAVVNCLHSEDEKDVWEDGTLQKIDGGSIHRICSGQVIVDFVSVIKELIENSIDAQASVIRILIEQGGFQTIQITDNGTGIAVADYQSIALKHYTSKIKDFQDLQDGVTSLGFRGEAISSMCALSQNVTITTRTRNDNTGVRIRYDNNGYLIDVIPTSHPVGTTVKVDNMFYQAPVRLESFKKKHKREYNKMISLIQEYSVAHNNITFQVSGEPFGNKKQLSISQRTILTTTGNGCLKDAISSVYGYQQVNHLENFSFISDSTSIEGFVSKLESSCGRRSGDRQFYTLNGRPVDLPKFSRVFNEFYRKSNPYKYPVLFLACKIQLGTYDINIAPNKRAVMLEKENELLMELREYVSTKQWSLQSNTFASAPIVRSQSSHTLFSSPKVSQTIPKTSLSFANRLQSLRSIKSSPKVSASLLHDEVEEIEEFLPTPPSPVPSTSLSRRTQSSPGLLLSGNEGDIEISVWNPTPNKFRACKENDSAFISKLYRELSGTDKLEEELHQLLRNNVITIPDDHPLVDQYRHEYCTSVYDCIEENIVIQFSLEQLKEKMKFKKSYKQTTVQEQSQHYKRKYFATLDTPQDESSSELDRTFDKQDFDKIEICGQFNLGFIIGKLGKDLFIFDQHACDEKFNYERLYRTLEIKVQRLIQPQKLQLAPGDEDIIISEREIFKMNGFQFNYLYNEAPGCRISLITLPYSKNTSFTAEDVMEMVALLRDSPGVFCRPSKIQKLLASRACRSSIMIGNPLSVPLMRQVTTHMTNLDNPWCCPHGRPTMRHLYALTK